MKTKVKISWRKEKDSEIGSINGVDLFIISTFPYEPVLINLIRGEEEHTLLIDFLCPLLLRNGYFRENIKIAKEWFENSINNLFNLLIENNEKD